MGGRRGKPVSAGQTHYLLVNKSGNHGVIAPMIARATGKDKDRIVKDMTLSLARQERLQKSGSRP